MKRNITQKSSRPAHSFRRILYILAAPILLLAAASCGSDEPDPEPVDQSRTVLVYMVANNDLGSNGWERADFKEMMSAVNAGSLKGGRLLVYRNTADSNPDRLVELLPDSTENVLVTYDGSDGLLSIDADRMKQVIADARRLAPASVNGIVFWSHGTGWIEESSSRGSVMERSFGLDNRKRMKITQLAEALRPTPFDWIYFDCCHLGTIETIYELRDAAPTIVASTPELPLEGMPYDRNIPYFFSTPADLVGAARTTYNYYLSDPAASNRSCGIAVYDTRKLPALAAATRAIMETSPTLPDDYEAVPYARYSLRGTIFDMAHYVNALSAPSKLLQDWNNAYQAVVTYSAATPTCYGFDMSNFSGFGCMIVRSKADITMGYDNYAWYTDVVSHNPLLQQ